MRLAPLSLALMVAACGGSSSETPMPDALVAEGFATVFGTTRAERLDCEFQIELVGLTLDRDSLRGEAVGEVFRRSFRNDALSFEFSALVGGPGSVTARGVDFEVRLVGDQPDDALPLWRALEVLRGVETAPFTYEGSWTCATIFRGLPDTPDLGFTAPGTWRIHPR